MLSQITVDTYKSVINSYNEQDSFTPKELYKQMFKEQPVLKKIVECACENLDNDQAEGYVRGVLQAWHLLNQQELIDNLQ